MKSKSGMIKRKVGSNRSESQLGHCLAGVTLSELVSPTDPQFSLCKTGAKTPDSQIKIKE